MGGCCAALNFDGELILDNKRFVEPQSFSLDDTALRVDGLYHKRLTGTPLQDPFHTAGERKQYLLRMVSSVSKIVDERERVSAAAARAQRQARSKKKGQATAH